MMSRLIRYYLIALPILFALALASCGEDGTTDPVATTDPVIVAPASLSPVAGGLVIDSVYSDGPGFLVVHRDNGSNAPVVPGIIGKAALSDGWNTGVTITLDSVIANGEKLWLMLHTDDGVLGAYEFEGLGSPDQPVMVGTAVVMTSFTISQTDPMIEVADQVLENNSVALSAVSSPDQAWVVFHKSENGAPGAVITSISTDAGTRPIIAPFPDDPTNRLGAGDTVWAMLHVDRGTRGTYEFPGPDAPMRDRDGMIVMKPFVIEAPDLQSVVAEDQSINEGELIVRETWSNKPGWIVIHEDNGNGIPKNDEGVGRAFVFSGHTTGITVKLSGPIEPGIKLWAVLHADDTPIGSWDYPDADLPIEQNGTFVGDSFDLQ